MTIIVLLLVGCYHNVSVFVSTNLHQTFVNPGKQKGISNQTLFNLIVGSIPGTGTGTGNVYFPTVGELNRTVLNKN